MTQEDPSTGEGNGKLMKLVRESLQLAVSDKVGQSVVQLLEPFNFEETELRAEDLKGGKVWSILLDEL